MLLRKITRFSSTHTVFISESINHLKSYNEVFTLTSIHWLILKVCITVSLYSTLHLCFLLHQSTPLHWAAGRGLKDTVQYLVQNKANIAIENQDGVSIFIDVPCTYSPLNIQFYVISNHTLI